MSLIHDIYNKVAHWRQPPVTLYAPAEMLVCSNCGKKYVSRGKYDLGCCRECEEKKNAVCVGGPLDGSDAYDKR